MTVRGKHPATGCTLEFRVRDGIIDRVEESREPVAEYISPGWLDLQVNGFAGVDYNDPEAPADEIARSIEAQRATGVVRFYPTVITGSPSAMQGSLSNLARARRTQESGDAMLGFHVEGPWISAHDGPRGAHPREHVRPPSVDEFKRLQDAAEGNMRLVTLSPEHDQAPAVIEHMVREGVVVAIGHTAANAEQLAEAIAAGASMSTHLGNGAHAQVPRHDNYILRQLADDNLYAGFIADGVHLPPHFVRLALRAKGPRKSILVTDAVAPAGCPPGIYKLGEQQVELAADSSVRLPGSGRLAGSALSMDCGVANAMRFAYLNAIEATSMATSNPAEAMGLPNRTGYLEVREAADFTLFRLEDEADAFDRRRVRVVRTVAAA